MALDDHLLHLNQKGIFPGPQESDEAFFARADALSAEPEWIDITFDSKGLAFWEGAATYIEEKEEGGRVCKVQLKDNFLTRLYPKEEIIEHEKVHAKRLMFDEKRFEEILAYQTSKNRFRRYFGPLFSSPTESKIFLALMLLPLLAFWAEIIFDGNFYAGILFLLPLFALGFGIFRLHRSQRIFAKALRHLQKITTDPFEVAIRLTDVEMELFAKSTPEDIYSFAGIQKDTSLRWKQLFLAYF